MVPIEEDFQSDLKSLIAKRLASDGYTIDPAVTCEDALRTFFQVQHRKVRRRPRRAMHSSELAARQASLPEDQRQALQRIQQAVEQGDDLNPYLSRQLAGNEAFEKHDGLLNHLGVQHLHLGNGLDHRGLIKGTSDLLFVLVEDDAIYFIDVFNHKSFASEEPFRIAEKNWPSLFDRFVAVGLTDNGASTPEERATVRRNGGNVLMVGASGRLYWPPGGGIAASGIARGMVTSADRMLDLLDGQRKWCAEHADELADRIVAAGRPRPSTLRLRLLDLDEVAGLLRVAIDNSAVIFNISFGGS
jgi:hypothetical protein